MQPDSPEQIESWTTWFFESRFTGHLSVAFLVYFAVKVIGELELLWDPLAETTVLAGALAFAGLTYTCDRALDRWFGDE